MVKDNVIHVVANPFEPNYVRKKQKLDLVELNRLGKKLTEYMEADDVREYYTSLLGN